MRISGPKIILLVFLAGFLCEGFLRLVIPFEIMFQTWFTRGIHTPDNDLGLVYTKNFTGFMRHYDRVWNVPLYLDSHGFRSVQQTGSPGKGFEIVLIGGASIVFCYGLPDEYTIHAEVARTSAWPVRVYNTAWPGLDLFTNFHVYKRLLEEEVNPRIVILNFWGTTAESFDATLPEDGDFERFRKRRQSAALFTYFSDQAVFPEGKLAGLCGRWYYASYVLAGMVSFGDKLIDTGVKLRNVATNFSKHVTNKSTTSPLSIDNLSSRKKKGLIKFRRFMMYLEQYFWAKDCQILINFLPCSSDKNFYAGLKSVIPPGIRMVDLNNELCKDFEGKSGYIALNHYNKRAALQIALRLSAEIDDIFNYKAFKNSRQRQK